MNEMDIRQEDVKANEPEQAQAMEQELTDEQLLQLAEGSCTWGANCGK